MTSRVFQRTALGFAAFFGCLACAPKPSAPPVRPRTADVRPVARKEASPPPAAPRGPDLDGMLLGTARLGAMHELDRRVGALVPSLVPAPLVQGLVTRRLLPELVRELGLNALILDALDLTRPAVFGALAPTPGGQAAMKPQIVALVPLRGDPRLVVDALKVSYPESTEAPWGGLRVRLGDKTLAWVHAREGWAAVAPTAPLLDSAARTLAPLARGVEEGTLQVELRWARILAIYQPVIVMAWRQLQSMASGVGARLQSRPEGVLLGLMPMAEKLAVYLASLERVDLFGRIADDGWSFRLKVTPTAGGKAAEWVAGLRSPGRFGVDLLPPEAAVVRVDRRSETARLLATKVFELVTSWATQAIVARDLPSQVKERGLMNRKAPAPLELYRRTLRDLNLVDYRASYVIYRLVFELQALRQLLSASASRLVRASSGESATALYFPGGHLGAGQVEGLKSLAAHRGAMMALSVGLQRQATALLSSLWEALPLEVRDGMGMRASPLRLVYSPVALQVGRVTVSSLALRMRWPALPALRGGAAASPERERAVERLEAAKKVVEHLFGKGDPTFAWAYVKDRVVYSMGHDWQARMKAVLWRAGVGQPTFGNYSTFSVILSDPRFQNAMAGVKGDSLSLTFVSGARLLLASLAVLKLVEPRLSSAPGPMGMFVQQLAQTAAAAQHASFARESREDGAWVLEGRIPNDDLRSVLVGAGFLFLAGGRSSTSAPPAVSVPHVSPPQP